MELIFIREDGLRLDFVETPPPKPVYEIIPQWVGNEQIPGTWTVAVAPLFNIPKSGNKDGITLTTRWDQHMRSINSTDAYKVIKIQGGFWANSPYPRVEKIGIMGQRVTGDVFKQGSKVPELAALLAEDWLRVDTYKLSELPYYDKLKTHEVYMIDRENRMRMIRSFPVKIILISETGHLWIQMSRLMEIQNL